MAPPSPRTATLFAGSLAVVLGAVALHHHHKARGGDERAAATAAITRFAAARSHGDDAAAAALTDRPRTLLRALRVNRSGLDGARAAVRVGRVVMGKDERTASATLTVRWAVPAIGAWRSTARATLRRGDAGWRVRFTPRLVDAHLSAGTRLGTASEGAARATILDRDGRALVRQRAVVEVGLRRDRVADTAASARALAAIVDVDAKALRRQLVGAGKRQFVLATTLRAEDYNALAGRLHAVPGLETVATTQPLAPSRTFARALLGGIGPATAEQVAASGGRLRAGDDTGQWGLQRQFDARLRSTGARRVVVRDDKTEEVVRTIKASAGDRGHALRTLLSRRAQDAAEAALGPQPRAASLVAVQPSTGDVLAVANRPTDDTFDRALNGVYPPGSTFKVVTTDALLRRGLDVDTVVPCPKTLAVDGRGFHNFEGEAGASPTFASDFATSCNTALISLAGRLRDGDLTAVAKDFGVGRSAPTSVDVAASRVPKPQGEVAHAAAMIGQDRITVTPLAMAGVAATVAAGRWNAPRILADDPSRSGPALPAGELQKLRKIMRLVVTSGTGTPLAGIPGEVIGKSGTAEFGSGDPPPTHAWFIAARGDLALAVIVERGRSGSSVAAPIAASFFRAYDEAG
ncbi:penicillin-binding transpeptidase domain-containing protein [Baekduia alba]|uniref:penicillin-binding transpeptidase domain-containing protein n=1 Tax=Baekduia alba TaxID=2997333 RepID=UPI00234265DA|nr:penicillin-binding transpeptidase domain-containing protein [Baekduia alba]